MSRHLAHFIWSTLGIRPHHTQSPAAVRRRRSSTHSKCESTSPCNRWWQYRQVSIIHDLPCVPNAKNAPNPCVLLNIHMHCSTAGMHTSGTMLKSSVGATNHTWSEPHHTANHDHAHAYRTGHANITRGADAFWLPGGPRRYTLYNHRNITKTRVWKCQFVEWYV